MKKSNKFLPLMTFLMGIGIGITLLSVFSFTRSSEPVAPPAGLSPVSDTAANTLFTRYIKKATFPTKPFQGFFLDTQEFDAMNLLAKGGTVLSGFRIYLGKDANGTGVGIVVGVDSKGLDAISNGIYRTDSPKAGPCPIICDATSPITK